MARTADTLKTTRRSNDRWVIYDPSLRTHVNVDEAQELYNSALLSPSLLALLYNEIHLTFRRLRQ
jgi:hypothetical protein